jgi:hypothetical protein
MFMSSFELEFWPTVCTYVCTAVHLNVYTQWFIFMYSCCVPHGTFDIYGPFRSNLSMFDEAMISPPWNKHASM